MAKDPSKTEQATPKRINKTRNEGNVAKSQEISKFITIAAGTTILTLYMPVIYKHMTMLFQRFLGHAYEIEIDAMVVKNLAFEVVSEVAIMLLPPLFFIAFCVWLVLRMQVGKLWTTKVFKFKWSRFNPINGLKNMIASPQTLIRLGKSLVMAIIIGYVPYKILLREIENFLPLFYADVFGIANFMLTLSLKMVAWTLLPMGVIAGIDYAYTKWQYGDNLKMSKQEVKDEHRQSEGDPAIKAKQRQKMMAMIAQRMMQNVPKADVVITNPTHIAVAIRYDATEAPAPIIVAIGADRVAERIKEIAREHNVPIRENVPLARALYKSVDVGDMIPEDLYKAVASILATIWKMKGKMQ